jgi:putative phosphoesterase
MKVALLADVHGNSLALRAVLAAATESRCECLVVAGDLVGYYYDACGVLAALDGWSWHAVRGNHEDMLRDWRDGLDRERIRQKYGSGLAEACERLESRQIDQLVSLPDRRAVEIAGRRVLICHGAPWGVDVYIYPDAPEEVRQRLLGEDADLIVFGHTHYPVVWRDGGKAAVNPGSVGQPRDGSRGASWALWDSESGDVEIRRETYDVAALIAECRRRDPAVPYLSTVLERVRTQ